MRVKPAAVVLAALVISTLAGCASTPNSVGYTKDGSPPHVVPAVTDGKHKFYSQGQVDAVWREVTWKYPGTLPKGIHFPHTAPPYFHPNDGTKDLYQTGLPRQLAAQYWQCAWLQVAITARAKNDSATLTAAQEKLPQFQDLPGMRSAIDLKADTKDFTAEAEAAHLPLENYEFEINCGFYKSFSRKP